MTATPLTLPDSVDAVVALLATQNYVCDRRLATALFLSLKLQRPLFVEGEPGVGKTELGKTLARALGTALLRRIRWPGRPTRSVWPKTCMPATC
jgi:MoxR-like ATPase